MTPSARVPASTAVQFRVQFRWPLRRFLQIVGAMAAFSLALTGCTGSPSVDPSQSSTSASTPSPVAPAYKPGDAQGKAQNVPLPDMPEEAKAHTKEGLQAFMKHWVTLLNYAYETGDTKPLFKVTGSGCKTCNNVHNVVDHAYSDDKWMAGGSIMFVSADPGMQPNEYGQIAGVVTLTQAAGQFMNADGTVRNTAEGSVAKSLLFLAVERDSGWEIGDIGSPGDGK